MTEQGFRNLLVKKVNRDYKYISKYGNVLIFGISLYSEIVIKRLEELQVDVKFILDNDPHQIGRKWRGVDVVSPESIIKKKDDVIVIICTDMWNAKQLQLQKLGLQTYQILNYCRNNSSIIKKTYELMKAIRVYKRWRRLTNRKILYCHYPGIGDGYLTGKYLKGFLKKHHLEENQVTVICISERFKEVLSLFGPFDIIVASPAEDEAIKVLFQLYNTEKMGLYYLHYWGIPYQRVPRICYHNGISFSEMFNATVFGCEDDYSMPVFNNNFRLDSELLNKTVLIAPSANTFSAELDAEWWEELVRNLNDMGLYVVTNTNKVEEVIPGSSQMFLGFADIVPALNQMGYFISVRSGLSDLSESSDCNKYIIYQDYMPREEMERFSLANMYGSNNLNEYKLSLGNGREQELLNRIVQDIRKQIWRRK